MNRLNRRPGLRPVKDTLYDGKINGKLKEGPLYYQIKTTRFAEGATPQVLTFPGWTDLTGPSVNGLQLSKVNGALHLMFTMENPVPGRGLKSLVIKDTQSDAKIILEFHLIANAPNDLLIALSFPDLLDFQKPNFEAKSYVPFTGELDKLYMSLDGGPEQQVPFKFVPAIFLFSPLYFGPGWDFNQAFTLGKDGFHELRVRTGTKTERRKAFCASSTSTSPRPSSPSIRNLEPATTAPLRLS